MHQPPTTPPTKSTTSRNLSSEKPEKEAVKASKKAAKASKPPPPAKGSELNPPGAAASNSDFNLNDAKPIKPPVNATYTDEDAALDRELAAMDAQEAPSQAQISDIDPSAEQPVVNKEPKFATLREIVEEDGDTDYQPAETINQLEDQVHYAKQNGAEAIEGTAALVAHFNGRKMPKSGYIVYKGIRVYAAGELTAAESLKAERETTVEKKLFGKPKNPDANPADRPVHGATPRKI